MFSSLLQKAGFKPGLALHSTIPKVLMAAAMLGGTGSLLSAGSAQAINLCQFGTPSPASVAPVCTTALNFLTTGDKTLTFTTLPTVGSGLIDFTNTFTNFFDVRVLFTPGLDGPGASPIPRINGLFAYNIDIIPGNPFYFEGVKLSVNGTQDVDTVKTDVTTGGPFFATLTSLDSQSPIPSGLAFAPISGNRTSLSVTDTYSLGLGRLTSFTNAFQQVEVPGPLPLMGAGMAFGFSRKLRNRIKASSKAKA